MEKAKHEMDKAKEEMKTAKKELTDIKDMTNEMEKDGLINSKDGYSIEYKDKQLLINNKSNHRSNDKYCKYFKGENFKIKSSSKD